jgi:phosphate transport system protein
MRKEFDYELNELNIELTKMAQLVIVMIDEVIQLLQTNDTLLADQIINKDSFVNEYEKNIESKAFHIMLRQQPIAKDLRNLTSALKIVNDLERIGDQATDIAEIMIDTNINQFNIEHIYIMSKKTKIMVKQAVEAYIKQDLSLVHLVEKEDDEVDQLFNEVKDDVISLLKQDSIDTHKTLDILMIAKHLEKASDHAVRMCKWIEFNQTGKYNDIRLI